jgi:hypothetical protein
MSKEKKLRALQVFQWIYVFGLTMLVAAPAFAGVEVVLGKIRDVCMSIVDNDVWTAILLLVFVVHIIKWGINHNIDHIYKGGVAGISGGLYFARHELWSLITS